MTIQTPEQIEVCDRGNEPEDPGDVTFCDQSENDEPQDVKICEQEQECPAGTEQLSISGTSTPVSGSGYSVSGGIGPFTWSVTGGPTTTITGPRTMILNGVTGKCGTGTITVTDLTCGFSATKDIKLPNGQWVLYAEGLECKSDGIHNCWGATCDVSRESGPWKITGTCVCCSNITFCAPPYGPTGEQPPVLTAAELKALGHCPTFDCGDGSLAVFAFRGWTLYRWECS